MRALFQIPRNPPPKLQRINCPLLADFVSKVLVKDIEKRPVAKELVSHPLMKRGAIIAHRVIFYLSSLLFMFTTLQNNYIKKCLKIFATVKLKTNYILSFTRYVLNLEEKFKDKEHVVDHLDSQKLLLSMGNSSQIEEQSQAKCMWMT